VYSASQTLVDLGNQEPLIGSGEKPRKPFSGQRRAYVVPTLRGQPCDALGVRAASRSY
jgi:hypothetical protein